MFELLVDLVPVQKMVGLKRLVMIAGRNHDAVHSQPGQHLAHLFDLFHAGFAEHRGVGTHGVPELFAALDHFNGRVKDARLVTHKVVGVTHTIQMHVNG